MTRRPFLALVVVAEIAGCRSAVEPKPGECPAGTVPIAVGDTIGWAFNPARTDSAPMVVVSTNTRCFHKKAA